MVKETETQELKTESTAVGMLFKSLVKKKETEPNPYSEAKNC